jgi:hypothetical protein
MKQLAYALPIVALACSPALAQQDRYDDRADTDASAAGGVQIPPYEPERGPRAGSWEATLGGSGASIDEFDRNTFGLTGSLGYYVTPWMPVGVRQTANLDFGDNVSDAYVGISRAFIDFQAPLGAFQPYVGGIIGAQYGKGIDDKFIYGPEAGIKYWVNESTFLFGQGEWQVVEGEAFKNANAVYAFGFGLNF